MNLVYYYKSAQQTVYGNNAYVSERDLERFSALEVELMEHRISPEHYARAQAIMWKYWVTSKGLSHLPANIFLGEVSKKRYNHLLSQPTVEPVMEQADRVKALGLVLEKQFLEYYLERVLYNGGDVDEERHLNSFLDSYQNEATLFAWADYCELVGQRSDLVREVIHQYAMCWKLEGIQHSYRDLAAAYIKALKITRTKLTKRLYELDTKRAGELTRIVSNMLMAVEQELESVSYGG